MTARLHQLAAQHAHYKKSTEYKVERVMASSKITEHQRRGHELNNVEERPGSPALDCA
jgi:hypothetical protein